MKYQACIERSRYSACFDVNLDYLTSHSKKQRINSRGTNLKLRTYILYDVKFPYSKKLERKVVNVARIDRKRCPREG